MDTLIIFFFVRRDLLLFPEDSVGVPQERNYVPHISAVKVFLKPEFYFGTFFCVWNTPKGYQFKDTRISDSFGSPLKRK